MQYVGERIEGEYATVRALIVTQKGTQVPVEARVLRRATVADVRRADREREPDRELPLPVRPGDPHLLLRGAGPPSQVARVAASGGEGRARQARAREQERVGAVLDVVERVNSSSQWLRPPREGTKIMPVGQMAAMYCASWPAPERMRRWPQPSAVAAASTTSTTSGSNGVRGTRQ